jgi:hypothetical protein
VGQQHALTARGLHQIAGAAAAEVDVDDQRRARALLVEGGRLGELLRLAAQRGEPAPRGRQRDRVVDV